MRTRLQLARCGCATEPPLNCGLCATCARVQIEIALSQSANGTTCTNCADWFQAENVIVDADGDGTCSWSATAYLTGVTGCGGINNSFLAKIELIDDNPGVTVRLTLVFYQIFTSPSFTYYQTVVYEYSFPTDPIDCCADLDGLALAFVSQTGSTQPANYKDDYAMGDTYFCDFYGTTATLYPVDPPP